jgi:tripartite-type tricarboxylate transporter receptor subunit TctC
MKVQKAMAEALMEPTTNKRLTDLGDEVIGSPPQVLADYMKSEMKRWGPLIKAAQIKVDG